MPSEEIGKMTPEALRKEAVKRVKAKQNWWKMAGGFVIIWLILIVIWALTSKDHSLTGFWPIWAIFGMGIALAFTGWSAFGPQTGITDAQVEAEMRKMQDGG